MLAYLCDWCKRAKKPGEKWIVGLAAESVGAATERAEVVIHGGWSEDWARHNLAVHFCSEGHKNSYIRALLFEEGSVSPHAVRRRASVDIAHSSVSIGIGQAIADETKTATRTKARKPKPRRKAQPAVAQFTELDEVRAHGLSVHFHEETPGTENMS